MRVKLHAYLGVLGLLSVLLGISGTVRAQVQGTFTIGVDYPNLAAAFSALGTQTAVGSGVTINVPAGYTETLSSRLILNATGTASSPIIIQKSGSGANPVITAWTGGTATINSATPDGILSLVGSDYVTIDGINFNENAANSGAALMEYGIGLFKNSGTDGANNNTIINCTITMNRANVTTATSTALSFHGSHGIWLTNATPIAATTSITVTSAAGSSSNNRIYNDTIRNVNTAIALCGFGATDPTGIGADLNNDIGGTTAANGNRILGFGGGTGATSACAAVFMMHQWSFNVAFNTINNMTGTGATTHPNVQRGIFMITSSPGASGNINNNNLNITVAGTIANQWIIDFEGAQTSPVAGQVININNNTISGTGTSLTTTGGFYGIFANTAATTLNIQNNVINGFSYGGTNTATNPISAAIICNTASQPGATFITNNLIQNLSASNTGTLCGIANTTVNPNLTISNNQIIGITTTSTGIINGITNTTTATNLTIRDNRISNITRTGTATGTALTNGINIGICTQCIIERDTVENIAINNVNFTGNVVCIAGVSTATNTQFRNNLVRNINVPSTNTVWGIRELGPSGLKRITGNQVFNFSTTPGGAGTHTFHGIALNAGTTDTVSGNTVYNLVATGTTTCAVNGISISSGTTNHIFQNKISRIGSIGHSTPTINGISVSGGTTNNLSNNLVDSIFGTASNSTNTIAGINVSGGTNANLFYNTVLLNGVSTGANYGSSALSVSTTPNLVMNNNVLVNLSPANGTGLRVAYRRSTATSSTHGISSGNNVLFAGTPSTNSLLFHDGTNAEQTVIGYSNRLSPAEATSGTENVSFQSLNIFNTNFLRPNTASPTLLEGRAAVISGITVDAEGTTRNSSTPDIGAYEISGTPATVAAPTSINFSSITNTSITIGWTDNSTIESGFLIYRSLSVGGPWTLFSTVTSTSSATTGTTYSATAGGLTGNTTYFFQIVAVNGLSSSPLTGSSATAACAGGLSGTYNIPGDFNSIGNAITQANALGFAGPVVFNLMPTYTSTNEVSFPITVTDAIGCANATNTLTIRPDATVSTPVSISSSGTQTILLNGAKYVTIDGRAGGSGTPYMLLLNNTNTSGTNIMIQNDASFNTITYCDIQGRNSLTTASGGLITFGTANSTFLQGNDNNIISNNLIHSNGVNAASLLVATGSTTTNAAINDNNQIVGNQFYDFGLSGTASFAVKIDVGNNAWIITDNQVYQTQPLNLGTSALTYRAFWITPNTGALSNVSGYTISRNTVGGSGSGYTGSWVMSSTGGMTFQAFDISIGLGTPSNISENTVGKFNFTTGSTSPTAFQGIGIANGQVNVLNNLIGSRTVNTSPYDLTFTTTGSLGGLVGIRLGAGNAVIQGNTVAGLEIIGNNTTVAPSFIGIQNASGSTTSTFLNDTIGSPTLANSILVSSTSETSTSASIVRGITSSSGSLLVSNNIVANITDNYAASGTQGHVLQGIAITAGTTTQVNNNNVFNLTTSARTTGTTTNSHLAGIVYSTTASAATVSNNLIYNLNNVNTSLNGASVLSGIYFNGSAGNTYIVEKNNVHSLAIATTASSSPIINGIDLAAGNLQVRNNMIRLGINGSGASVTGGFAIRGVNKGSGNASVQHNTIYISGANVLSSTINSAAYNRVTASANDTLRNNILANNRSNSSGTAKHFSILLVNTNTIVLNSNLYFGTGSGYVFANNGSNDFTAYLPSWIPSDLTSYFGNPGFVNAEGNASNVDLHIISGVPTLVEGSGEITSPISDDFDNQTRAGLTPVDLGADAGNFTSSACNGVPTSVTAIRSSNTTLCGSGSNTVVLGGGFSALPGYTFQWQQSSSPNGPFSNIASANSFAFATGTITSTTYYQCIVACPTASASVTSSVIDVVVNPLPTVSITSPANNSTVCSGSMVRITASGNADSIYTWTANNVPGHGTVYVLAQGNTGQSVTSYPTATSYYAVTARNKSGCTAVAFDTLLVSTSATVPSSLRIVSNNLNCTPGAPTTLTVNHNGTAGSGTWTYNWTTADGATQLQNTANSSLSSDNYILTTPTTPGQYRYKVTLTNTFCPESYAEAVIPVNVGYFADVVTTPTNCGNNGTLSIWPQGANSSYSNWYTNDFNSNANGYLGSASSIDTFKAGTFNMLSNGLLNLSTNNASLNGMFIVKNPNSINTQGLRVNFDLTTTPRGFNFGFLGSDGLAWSYAPDIPNSVITPGGTGTNAENGTGTGVKLAFDAATNSATNIQGVYLMYNCNASDQGPQTPGVLAFSPGSFWQGLSNAPVSITISDSGYITVYINNILVFNNVKLPDAYLNADKSTWRHAFSGRTGGAFQQQSIDNLQIQYPNYEYSIDSVNWQNTRSFSGLAAGSYPAYVRNPSDPSCVTRVGNATVSPGSLPSVLNVIPSVGFNSVVCSGNSTNLTTDIALPGASYNWFTSNSATGPFTAAPGTNNSSTYTTPSLTASQFFRVEVSCPSSPVITSNSLKADVNVGTVASTNSPQVVGCQGGSATLTATPGSNTNLVWYAGPTGGSPIGTGSSLVVTPSTFPTTYFVEPVSTAFTNIFLNGGQSVIGNAFGTSSTQDGVSTRFTTTASVRIDSIKVFPAASGTLTVTLAVSGSATPLATFNMVIVPSQVGNAIPINVPVNFVVPSSGNYQIFTSGIACHFYPTYTGSYSASYMTMASGVFVINGGSNTLTGASSTGIYGTAFYFGISTSCPTPPNSRVPVVVNSNPAAVVTVLANNASICQNRIQSISATSATTYSNYSWSPVTDLFMDANATIPYVAGTHAPIVYARPSSVFTNRVYTVTASNVGCFNTATDTLTSLALPAAPGGTPGSRCGNGSVNISATPAAGATIDWYDAASGGNLLLAGSNSFATPSISSNTTYFAEARNTTTGCISTSRTAVLATVNTPSAASVSISASNTAICPGLGVTFTATPTNGGTPSYQWFVNNTQQGTNSNTFTSTSLNPGDVVKVEMTASICATPAVAVSNNINLTTPSVITSNPSLTNPSTPTSNNGTINLGLTGGSGSNFTFQVFDDLTNTLLGFNSASNSGIFNNVPSGSYRIEVTDLGVNAFCPGRVTNFYATLSGPVTTFDGTSWSFGPPSGVTDAVITGNNSAPGTFSVRNLTIASGANINNGSSIITVRGHLYNSGSSPSPSGVLFFNGGGTSTLFGNRFLFGGTIRIGTGTTLSSFDNLRLLDGGSLLHGTGTTGGGGSFVGPYQHQRNGSTSQNLYNYWSSPTANQTVAVLGSTDVRAFDASTQTWNPSAYGVSLPSSTIMNAGKGYTATNAGSPIFRGQPNDGTFNVTMNVNPGTDNDWNLLGNPYPSAINGTSFLTQNSASINGAVYFWNKPITSVGTATGADYETRNLLSGSFTIPSHQGFFVEALATTALFNNTQRVSSNGGFFRQNSVVQRAYIRLTTNHGDLNSTLVGFTDQATDSYDHLYDARKLEGNPYISFYSILGNQNLAIQGLAELNQTKIVPLGFRTTRTGTFSISIQQLENVEASTGVILEDLSNGQMHNLRNGAYSFNLATSGTVNNRFRLHFIPLITSVQPDPQATSTFKVSGTTNQLVLFLNNNESLQEVTLLDMGGRLIQQWMNPTTASRMALAVDLREGIYMVRIKNAKGNYETQKVSIHP